MSAAPTPQLPTPSPESLQNLNPDFQVQCLQCGQSYPIRPDLYGQTVNCRCGAPIRFEDPLGAGGALTSKDPLGLKQEKDDGQPLAYQSQSKPSRSKLEARKREEEVLKMYIKDEEEFEKVTKPGKRKAEMSEGQAFVAGLTGVSGSTEGELSMTRIISAVVLILLLLGFGIGMILYPDAMDDTSVSSGRGAKAKLLILLWSFPTGIVLTSLGGVLTLLSCIMPKKIFLFLSTPDDE